MQEISGKYPQILTAVWWVSARKTYLFKLCSCRGTSECFEDNLREGKDVKNLGNILNEGLLALANTLSTICSHTNNNPYRLSVYVQEQQNSGSLRLVCFGFFNVLVSSNSSSCFFFFFSYKLGTHVQVNKTKLRKKNSFLEHHHNICIEKKKKLKRFISLVGTAVVC